MKASDGRKKKNREKRIARLQEQLKQQQALKRGRGRPKSQPKTQLLHPPPPQAARPPEKTPKPQLGSEPKQTEAEVPQSSTQIKQQQLKQQSAEIKQEDVKFSVNKETTSKRESLKKSEKTSPSQASSAQADIIASVKCKTEATTSVKAEQGLQKRQRHRKSFFEIFSAEVHKPHYSNRSKGKEADKEVIVIPDLIETEVADKNNESSNTKLDGATAGSSSKSPSVQSPDSIARRRQRRSINRFSRLPVESPQIADDTSWQKSETEPQSKKLSKGLQKLAEKVQQEEYEPVNQLIPSLEQRDKKEFVSRKGKSKFGKKNVWLTRQRKPILKNQQKQAEEQLPAEQYIPAVQQSTVAQQLPEEQQLQAKLSQRLEAKSPSRDSAPEETNTLEVSGRKKRLTSKSSPIRTSRRTSRLSELTQLEQSSTVSDGATVVVTEDKILPSSSVPAEGHQDEPIFPVSGKWIEVTCGSNTAHLCLDLTGYSCSGPQGGRALNKSVLYQGTMISPAELEAFSGVSNSRDWKRSLWHSGESIRNLIKSRVLQLSDNACCVCEACEAKKSSVEKSRETISGKALKTKPGQHGASSEVKDSIDVTDQTVEKGSAEKPREAKTTSIEPDTSAALQSGSTAASLVDSNVELSPEEKTEIMKIENPSDEAKVSKQIDVKTRKRTTYNNLSSVVDVYPSMGRRSGRSAENQESRSADRSADQSADAGESGRKRKRNSVDESVKRCKVSIESHPDLSQHVVVTVTSNKEKQSQHDDVSKVEIVKLQEDVKTDPDTKGKKRKKIDKGKKNSVTNVVSVESKDIVPVLTNEENSLKLARQNSKSESVIEDEPQTSKSIEIPCTINETDDSCVMEPALGADSPQVQVDDCTLSDDDAEVVQKTGIKRKRRHRRRTFTVLKKRSAGKPKNLAESETKSENLAESETKTKSENTAESETETKSENPTESETETKSENPAESETEIIFNKSENPVENKTESKADKFENSGENETETKSDKFENPSKNETETKSDIDEKCKAQDVNINEIKMEEKKIYDTVTDDDEKMTAEVNCGIKEMSEAVLDCGGNEVMDVSVTFENDTQKIQHTQEATGETSKIVPTQGVIDETTKVEPTQDVANETHLQIDKSDEESMNTAELPEDCSSSQDTELDSDQQGVASLPFNNCLTGLTQSSREIAIVEHSNYSNIYISTQTISKLSIIDTRFAGGSSEISSITSDIKSINTQLKSMTSQLKMSSTSYTPAIESGSNARAMCSAVAAPGAAAAATSCAQFDATNVTSNEQDKINNEVLLASDEEESANIKNKTIDTSAAELVKSDNITLNVKDCEVHVEEDSTSQNKDVCTNTKPNIESVSSDLNDNTDQELSSMNEVNLIETIAESSTSLNLNESSIKYQNVTDEGKIECVNNGSSALLIAETAGAVSVAESVLPSKANKSDDRTAHSSGLTVGEEITSAYIPVNIPVKTEDTEETKHIQSVPVCSIADQSGEIINVHSDGSMQSTKHESQNKALSVTSEKSSKVISVKHVEQKILSKAESSKVEETTSTLDCLSNTSDVNIAVSDSHDQMSSETTACGEVKDLMISVIPSADSEESTVTKESKSEQLHQSPSEADKVTDEVVVDSAVNQEDKSESVTNETCDTREENVGLNEAADSPNVMVKSARLSAVLAELKRGKRSGSQKPSAVSSKTEQTSNLTERTSSSTSDSLSLASVSSNSTILSTASDTTNLSSTLSTSVGSVSNVIPLMRVSSNTVSSVSDPSSLAENTMIGKKIDHTGIPEQAEGSSDHNSAVTGGQIQGAADQNVTKNWAESSGKLITECTTQPVSSEASLSTNQPGGSTSRSEESTNVPAAGINIISGETSSGSVAVPSSQQSSSESTRIALFKTSGKPNQAKVAPIKVSPMKHTATTSSQVSTSSKSDDSVCSQQGSSMSTLRSLSSLNPSDLLSAAGSSSPLSMLTPEAAAQLPLLSTAAAASGQLPYIFMGFPLGISAQQLVGSTATTQKQDVTQVKTIKAGVRQSDSQGSKSVMGRGAVDQKNKTEGTAVKRRRPAQQRAASSAATVPAHSSNTPRFSPFNSPISNQTQPCRPAHQSERPLGELLALHARSEAERLSHALISNRVLAHSESLPAHLDPTSGRLLIHEGFAGLSTAPVLPDERNFGLDLRRNSSASCSYTGQSDSVDLPLDYTHRSLDEFNRISQSELYDEAGALDLTKK